MIPYTTFFYFGLLLYILVPTLIIGFVFRNRVFRFWSVIAICILLALQYFPLSVTAFSTSFNELALLVGYLIYQLLVAQIFLWIRGKSKLPIFYVSAILLSLFPLLATKFLPLFSPNDAIGFLGISYITFRSLDVIFGIASGTVSSLSWIQYPVYLAFSPTISSGPIDRYQRFITDWNHQRNVADFISDIDSAIEHIFRGFLYKFILAELIHQYWLIPATSSMHPATILSYMYAYSLYLFFDFAGYSAFAIGVSNLFGIHTPENFNLPFISKNIRDFWERWHISLSSWFRDYVYSPIVFFAIKNKLLNKYIASYLAYLVTMILMGLWHGFTWYYIAYGLYHAALLILYDLWYRATKKHTQLTGGLSVFITALSIFITFNLICFGLLIFSGRLPRPF